MGKPISDERAVQLDSKALDELVGQYRGTSEKLTIRRDGNRLFAQDPENPEVELFAAGAMPSS